MTIKLISLVILALFLLFGHSYSEEQFIFPKKKPSIFKSVESTEKKNSNNLPQKKPIIQKETVIKKEKAVEKKKLKK